MSVLIAIMLVMTAASGAGVVLTREPQRQVLAIAAKRAGARAAVHGAAGAGRGVFGDRGRDGGGAAAIPGGVGQRARGQDAG